VSVSAVVDNIEPYPSVHATVPIDDTQDGPALAMVPIAAMGLALLMTLVWTGFLIWRLGRMVGLV